MKDLTNLITTIVQNSFNNKESMTFSAFFDFLDEEFNRIQDCLEHEGAEFMSKTWVLMGRAYILPTDITKENIDDIQSTFDWLSLDLKKA